MSDNINIPDGLSADIYSSLHGSWALSEGIQAAGIAHVYPRFYIDRKSPDFHLLIFTLDGRGRVTSGNDAYSLNVNDLLICPASVPYSVSGASGVWHEIWFHLEDSTKWAFIRGPKLIVAQTTHGPDIKGLFDLHEREWSRQESSDTIALSGLAMLLKYFLERSLYQAMHCDPLMAKQKVRFQDLWRYIDQHLDEVWNIDRMAAELKVSKSHFHRLVKTLYSRNAGSIIYEMRMSRAKDLLLGTDFPLKAIAGKVGYADRCAFSSAFFRKFGKWPSYFRSDLELIV